MKCRRRPCPADVQLLCGEAKRVSSESAAGTLCRLRRQKARGARYRREINKRDAPRAGCQVTAVCLAGRSRWETRSPRQRGGFLGSKCCSVGALPKQAVGQLGPAGGQSRGVVTGDP